VRKVLHCGRCGAGLTQGLVIRSTKDPKTPPPEHRSGQPLCTSGQAYKSYVPIARISHWVGHSAPEFVPQHWLNPDDVASAVKNVADRARLAGCCGPDGCRGPNKRCRRCGAVVDTLMADCWTEQVFIPDPSTTTFEDIAT
jgi:hypothetical protein